MRAVDLAGRETGVATIRRSRRHARGEDALDLRAMYVARMYHVDKLTIGTIAELYRYSSESARKDLRRGERIAKFRKAQEEEGE